MPPRFVEETHPPKLGVAEGIEGVTAATAYDLALSRVVAAMMAEDRRVRRFRAKHLPEPDGLLLWDAVAEWMSEHGPLDGEAAPWYALVPINPAKLWEAQAEAARGEEGTITLRFSFENLINREPRPVFISYVVPNNAAVHEMNVTEGTALDDLLTLVNFLGGAVPWTEEQASVFALTGMTPLIMSLQIRGKVYDRLATLPRLAVEADPRVTQRELSAAYQAARERLVSDARHRDLSEKHLALAVFGARREGRVGRLAQRMDRWNASVHPEHPEWVYRRTDQFSRDVGHALRRLLRDLPIPPIWDSAHDDDEE